MKLKQITSAVVTVIFAVVAAAVPAAAVSEKVPSPKNTKITAKTETSVSLQWDKVDIAAKYTVYYSTNNKKQYTAYNSTTKTKMTVKGLKTDTKYWFYVRAVDKDGNTSGYSKVVSAIPKAAVKTESTLKITKEAGKVSNNSTATVKIKGKPGTKYNLSVYYTTKKSTAKGTGTVTSDADGNAAWSWKVGAKTKPGMHKIVIEGGDEKIETTFETVE